MADPDDSINGTLQTEALCNAAGGYWLGANTDCGSGAIGYCCDTVATGYNNQQTTQGSCEYFGGTFNGSTPCPTTDPTGCCTGGAYDGQIVTETECTSGGGSYLGDGSACPDPTGCCSFNDPSQDNITTRADCTAQGGFYNGDGSTCTDGGGSGPPPSGGI